MKVTILHPVRHDGKRYGAGEVADMAKSAADALIVAGSAEPAGIAEAEAKARLDAEAKARAEAEEKARLDAAGKQE